MRIWLATVGEPLPSDGKDVRLLRTAQFARWLADHGHEVVFWTGTMDHYGRRLRHAETVVEEVAPNYRIVQLQGRLYTRSVSVSRFMNHADVARAFSAYVGGMEQPDIILASFPTEELCRHLQDYAEPRGIPIVIDVRDLWPDVFADILPGPSRLLAPLLFKRLENRVARVFRRATAVSGPAKSMIDWGLRKAGRKSGPDDFWFPFTYPPMAASDGDAAPDFMKKPEAGGRLWFCFFGALSARYNLEMVVDCFRALHRDGVPASVVICGTGDAAESLKQRAGTAPNIHFPGWMSRGQISAIMVRSHAGIFPYNTPDYFNNLPNKVCEYLAGGLPILSCTDGEVRNLIGEHGCGFWHRDTAADQAALVRELVAEPQKLTSAAASARKVHATLFDRDTVFSNTVAKLESIRKKSARVDSPSALPSAGKAG